MLERLKVAIVKFDVADCESLRAESIRFIHPRFLRNPGKNAERNASHYAGRIALGSLLHRVVPDGKIGRNDSWGYLEIYDARLQKLPQWFGNISHTTGIAVAVLGNTSVGIDVEAQDRSTERALKRAASEKERGLARKWQVTPPIPGMVALWGAKEAAAKALGLGINFGLQDFEVRLQGEMPCSIETHRKGPLPVEDLAVRFLQIDGFVIAISANRRALLGDPDVVDVIASGAKQPNIPAT